MTEKIESYIEFKVKQNWLKGMTRDENAADCGISTGSVSNIIKTFLDSLSRYDVESIREFVVHLRKENLTVKECAPGYRYKNILDNLEDLMMKIYKSSSKTLIVYATNWM